MKHGEGELYMPTGEVIHANWYQDRLHGEGYFLEKNG